MTIDDLESFLSKNKEFKLDNGIWYSSSDNKLSYPEDGNDECYGLEETSFWFKHRNNCLKQVITKYAGNSLFFDVGGGNGFTTKSLQEISLSAVLIEPGKKGVLNAKERNVKNIICGNLSDLKGLRGKVPAIGTFDVIEHNENDVDFVFNLYSMLKEKGYLFLTAPAFNFLLSDEDRTAGHYKRYNKKSITKLLLRFNFEIIYCSYFFSFLLFPIFLMRAIPYRLGITYRSKKITKREHQPKTGVIRNLVNIFCKLELKQISHNRIIPLGTSCLIVAKKKNIENRSNGHF
ncbi:MAG TPA: hypothetical protein PKN32_04605 [Bacteroidales bacterium]|nr:hypothetical protein [Bacteroidales bacterium]